MTNIWLPPEEYVKTIAQATSYACLYFTDTQGRPVQLRAVRSRETWQWPGGNLEFGETPWQCAVRECREETGIDFTGPQRLLAVHFAAQDGEWPVNHIGFVFDGGTLTDRQINGIELDPEEHCEVRVRTVEEWGQLMPPRGLARLIAVDEARRTGVVAYLEALAP
ncbi:MULTISPECIES: NUDIX domain-containing protein [unclassified Streptomyces]|uniref:NUDIX domain-containing protein n=1 Tax=unclassified Streptomyces TaxID=2593676 RepID=UPI0037F2AF64